MKLFLKISSQFICLLLMVHLLAINTQLDFYLKLVNQTQISKDFDIEKEAESKSKTSSENDSPDSEIDNFFENMSQIQKKSQSDLGNEYNLTHNFHFLENAYPKVHFEIPIPPPDFRG